VACKIAFRASSFSRRPDACMPAARPRPHAMHATAKVVGTFALEGRRHAAGATRQGGFHYRSLLLLQSYAAKSTVSVSQFTTEIAERVPRLLCSLQIDHTDSGSTYYRQGKNAWLAIASSS
jgi:hypothetical protein